MQKTAYEMRISDWSSDVCASDLAPLPAAAQAGSEPVTVFAAASTADALHEIAEAYAVRTSGSLRPVVASSSTLARPIEPGAPAAIFLSARAQWMVHLDEQRMGERRGGKECGRPIQSRLSQ